MTPLNLYWRGVIEAGPIEPPLQTVAYQMAEIAFNVWETQDEIARRLAPVLESAAVKLKALFA